MSQPEVAVCVCSVAQLYVSYKIQYMWDLKTSLINKDLIIGTNICLKRISCINHNVVAAAAAVAVDGQLQEIEFIIHTMEAHSIQ
jgi:hypothetical protein